MSHQREKGYNLACYPADRRALTLIKLVFLFLLHFGLCFWLGASGAAGFVTSGGVNFAHSAFVVGFTLSGIR